MNFRLSILTILFLCICSMSFSQIPPDTIMVISEKGTVPDNAKHKGQVKIGGANRTSCGYDITIRYAKSKARAKGANVVKITELKKPDAWSECYRLRAEVYHLENMQPYLEEKQRITDSALQLLLPADAPYALLFVYRPRSFVGVAVPFNIHVDDEVACNVASGISRIVKLTKTGKTKVWARTESRDELEIDVEPGKIYFVQATIGMGAFVGRPILETVAPDRGLEEFFDRTLVNDAPEQDRTYLK